MQHIPAFRTYIGCEYTASIVRKGKKRPFAILWKDEGFLQAFSGLATGPVDDVICKVTEDYACTLYGARNMVPSNKNRFRVFEKTFGPESESRPRQRLKILDTSAVPPCKAVLKQRVLRTNFVA